MDNKIKHLEEILKLMTQYKVNNVEIDGVKVEKLYHEFPEQDKKNVKSYDSMTDEELLFMSSNA
jgi:hypothetical protein